MPIVVLLSVSAQMLVVDVVWSEQSRASFKRFLFTWECGKLRDLD